MQVRTLETILKGNTVETCDLMPLFESHLVWRWYVSIAPCRIFQKKRGCFMAVDVRYLGADNKRKTMHKTASTTWTYAEGKLSHRLLKDEPVILSACDTLALCNLLHSHYDEIVREARHEQRNDEAAKEKKVWEKNFKR